MSYVRPWIGAQYFSRGIHGTRILIVGESAYKKGGYPPGFDESNLNISLVGDAIGQDEGQAHRKKSKFFTRIAWIFGYDPRAYEQRKELWSSLAYCNFITSIFVGPKEKPLPEHWESGKEAFIRILRDTSPDIAICFGQRVWLHIPKINDSAIENIHRAYARSGDLVLDDAHAVRLFSFEHPTREEFNWRYVQEIISMNVGLPLDTSRPNAEAQREGGLGAPQWVFWD